MSRRPHRARGVILMALAMLLIPIVDGVAKYLSPRYSPLFLGWARYAVASAIVLPLAAAVHGRHMLPSERLLSHVLRTAFLVTAMTLYFLAIARLPLATVVSAFFVGPIIAVALSVMLLGERMTWRKALALAVGAAGSMVILRPGGSSHPGLLLALGSGVVFALYLIATRHAAQASLPIPTLAFQCLAGTLFLAPQAMLSWDAPELRHVLLFAVLGGFSAAGHLLSIVALRHADASTLAPLVYVELVAAAAIGYVVFGEVPSGRTIAGAACIVAAGLILWTDAQDAAD